MDCLVFDFKLCLGVRLEMCLPRPFDGGGFYTSSKEVKKMCGDSPEPCL